MDRKHWIWITITIAIIHGMLTFITTPISSDILFSRFEGNQYNSPWDPLWLGFYFLLHIPYYILSYFASPIRSITLTYYLIWVGNSLVWGLMGAWLVSKLPFMKGKKEEPSEIQGG